MLITLIEIPFHVYILVLLRKYVKGNVNIFICANQLVVIFQFLHHSQCRAIQNRRSKYV